MSILSSPALSCGAGILVSPSTPITSPGASRPSFSALVAAEAEAGSLFQLLERAAGGQARIADMAALFWHCLGDRREGEERSHFETALLLEGVGTLLPVYRVLLSAVFGGR